MIAISHPESMVASGSAQTAAELLEAEIQEARDKREQIEDDPI